MPGGRRRDTTSPAPTPGWASPWGVLRVDLIKAWFDRLADHLDRMKEREDNHGR